MKMFSFTVWVKKSICVSSSWCIWILAFHRLGACAPNPLMDSHIVNPIEKEAPSSKPLSVANATLGALSCWPSFSRVYLQFGTKLTSQSRKAPEKVVVAASPRSEGVAAKTPSLALPAFGRWFSFKFPATLVLFDNQRIKNCVIHVIYTRRFSGYWCSLQWSGELLGVVGKMGLPS